MILTLEVEGEAADHGGQRVSGGGATAAPEPAGYGSAAGHHETITVPRAGYRRFRGRAGDIGVMVTARRQGRGKEDPLIELESDKATMEVPAPMPGTRWWR